MTCNYVPRHSSVFKGGGALEDALQGTIGRMYPPKSYTKICAHLLTRVRHVTLPPRNSPLLPRNSPFPPRNSPLRPTRNSTPRAPGRAADSFVSSEGSAGGGDAGGQIFAEQPAVRKAYLTHVPEKMDERTFWTRYCRAQYYQRVRKGGSAQGARAPPTSTPL